MLRFTKMNGSGNDFVMLDNRAGNIHLNRAQIARICDRHRGIGADGILLLETTSNGADFRMRYFNSDGGEAEMCGNGARCFARFANRVAGAQGKISFETLAGEIGAELQDELVTLRLSDPSDLRFAPQAKIEPSISSTAGCRTLSFSSRRLTRSMSGRMERLFVVTRCFRQKAQT